MIKINTNKCNEFAKLLSGIKISVYPYIDPVLFPQDNHTKNDLANFFFFIVAIDHRTHQKNHRYEKIINNKVYSGATLIFVLATELFNKNKLIFKPENLINCNKTDIIKWFNNISFPEGRAELLKDAATNLIKHYDGKVLKLFKDNDNFLIKNRSEGIINSLKLFKAYQDPIMKKSQLLIKILERRNIIKIKDLKNTNVSVDNILIRIALRANLITITDTKLKNIILNNATINKEQDLIIRKSCLEAYGLLSQKTGITPAILDDTMWALGKSLCPKKLDSYYTLPEIKIPVDLPENILKQIFHFMNNLVDNKPTEYTYLKEHNFTAKNLWFY